MLDLEAPPRLVAVAHNGIAARLGDLRREFEQSQDWPDMEVNAALFLSDVCRVLGLTDPERQAVLGPEAAARVVTAEGTHVVLYREA